jgi:hypothetical protein
MFIRAQMVFTMPGKTMKLLKIQRLKMLEVVATITKIKGKMAVALIIRIPIVILNMWPLIME